MEKILINNTPEKGDFKRNSFDGADILKFIMSFLVVATHTEFLSGALFPITRLAVPVFFVLSSYFFYSKANKLSKEESVIYFKSWSAHLLKMYAFWFVLLLPLTVYIGNYHKLSFFSAILKLFRSLLFSSTFQSSWFLSALLIGNAIVFFLSYKKVRNVFLVILGVCAFALALVSSNYTFLIRDSETLYTLYCSFKDIFALACRNFIVSIIYIVIGKLLSESDISKLSVRLCSGLSFFSVLFLIGESAALKFFEIKVYYDDCLLLLPACSVFITALALNSKIKFRYAQVLRKMSSIVYCLHMPVFMVMGKLMKIADIPDYKNILVFTLTLFVSYLGCFVIFKLQRYKPFKFLRFSY